MNDWDHQSHKRLLTMTCPDCWHIISYPRSGNHAVRALVERFSGRPTLGCPGNERDDPPIYLREENRSRSLIKIRDERHIARKSHFLREFIKQDAQEREAGLILITRDPLDAITSHIYPLVRPRFMSTRIRCIIPVRQAVDEYLSTVFAFRAMSTRRRIHVRYDDFVRPDSGVSQKLLQLMGFDNSFTEAQIEETLSLSFESLRRSGRARRDDRIVAKIRHEVSKRLTYAEVLALIDNTASSNVTML